MKYGYEPAKYCLGCNWLRGYLLTGGKEGKGNLEVRRLLCRYSRWEGGVFSEVE